MPVSAALPPYWPAESDWTPVLQDHLATEGFVQLMDYVNCQRSEQQVFPAPEDTFNALRLTPLGQTKVVILGQDPYHGSGQAHGLSFSVKPGIKIPPSLRNIFKERQSDLNLQPPVDGDLTRWARQGVLLLNTVLTVRSGQANSHRKQGWEAFTDTVIDVLSQRSDSIVFVLWGKPAEKKASRIADHHPTLISAHPSPLSAHRGFWGSRPFSTINEHLIQLNRSPIDWS